MNSAEAGEKLDKLLTDTYKDDLVKAGLSESEALNHKWVHWSQIGSTDPKDPNRINNPHSHCLLQACGTCSKSRGKEAATDGCDPKSHCSRHHFPSNLPSFCELCEKFKQDNNLS